MSTWADIQRLASDLQRVQLSTAAKKLSESNCIEVVSKLINKALIDVVFTRDGSTYVTRKHLRTEIVNECLGQGGRAAINEIATVLNVDYEKIEEQVGVIVEDPEYLVSNGELFSTEYVHRLSSELNQLLADTGVVSRSQLCRHWDLPVELLQKLLIDKLHGNADLLVDGENIYTRELLDAHKNTLRAVLAAVTKVTPVSSLQSRVPVPAARFFALWDELVKEGEIPGRILGSRTASSAVYVPHLHDQLVNQCIRNTLREKEYLQLSALKKLSISDAPAALKQVLDAKQYKELVFLPSLVATQETVQSAVQAVIDEVSSAQYCDVVDVLSGGSVPFSDADAERIVERVEKENKDVSTDGTFVFSSELLKRAVSDVQDRVEKRAHEECDRLAKLKKGGAGAGKKEEAKDDDWADSKKGGKGKKGKAGKGKKGGGGDDDDSFSSSAAASSSSHLVSTEELEKWLSSGVEVPEQLRAVVADRIGEQVNCSVRSRVAALLASQESESAASQKKTHQQLQQSASQLYGQICVWEQGAEKLGDSLAADLRAFLLKTSCTDLANTLLSAASGAAAANFSQKQRDETLASLPQSQGAPLTAIYVALKGDSLDAFHNAVFACAAPSALGLNLKTPNKEARGEIASQYALDLSAAAQESADPAAALLSIVLLLLARRGLAVHASGKYVSQLVKKLEEEIEDKALFDLVVSCQQLVVASLKKKGDEEVAAELADKLALLKDKVKEVDV